MQIQYLLFIWENEDKADTKTPIQTSKTAQSLLLACCYKLMQLTHEYHEWNVSIRNGRDHLPMNLYLATSTEWVGWFARGFQLNLNGSIFVRVFIFTEAHKPTAGAYRHKYLASLTRGWLWAYGSCPCAEQSGDFFWQRWKGQPTSLYIVSSVSWVCSDYARHCSSRPHHPLPRRFPVTSARPSPYIPPLFPSIFL